MYADRYNEFNSINKFISAGVPVIFVNTTLCTGFSSFLNERFSDYKTYHLEYNSQRNISLAEMIIQQLSKKDLETLQRIVNNIYGDYEKKFLSILAESYITGVGSLLSTLNEGKKGPCVYDLNYQLVYSLLPNLFKFLSKNTRIGFFIDGAQYVNKSDYDLIYKLANINNCYVLIGITEPFNDIYKLKSNLKNCNYEEIYFSRPTIELVIELAKIYDYDITEVEAQKLLTSCEYNIYKVNNYLKKQDVDICIGNIEKAIIFICSIFPQELEEQILKQILLSDENLIIDDNSFDTAIFTLSEYNIIEKRFSKLYLCKGNPTTIDIISRLADSFYYKKIVYNFIKCSNSNLELCYTLSRELCLPESIQWLNKFVIHKLRLGLPIESNILTEIEIQNNTKLLIIVYTYIRNYEKAKIKIEYLKSSEKLSNDYKKLYAIILNRCRNHSKAEKKLLKCIQKEPSNYILKAYLISNYIHQENITEAKKLYEEDSCNEGTGDIAYFYRNCGAAFWADLTPFQKAMDLFEKSKDWFGYYTTKCNLITRQMMLKSEDFSINDFKEIENKMAVYGVENMHVFYNNWGISSLLNDDILNAEKYFELADIYSNSKMPHIFIAINQACLKLKKGEYEDAKQLIDSIEKDVNIFPVNRVKQKFYINKALIYYCNNMLEENLLIKCEAYPDRYNPQYTKDIISFYKNRILKNVSYFPKDWESCFCPCYLEYWYINPLKLFSTTSINQLLSE